MRQMEGVLWRKGVLLSPQHLQAQDRFFEGLIDFQLSASTPFPWGFIEVELDDEAIESGTVAIVKASGIMPDGLMFSVPDPDVVPPPAAVNESWPEDARAVVVHLAVPERRPSGRNVGAGPADTGYRFIAEAVERRDENTGLAERPIQVARKNLRLLGESETLDGHTLLPVARVVKTDTGFEFDRDFVPPALAIGSSDTLVGIVRRLVELMVAKSAELSAARGERRKGVAHFGAAEVADFWLLHTVNTHLPHGRHLLEAGGRNHPSELFNWMLGLAGALTTFSRDVAPSDLPTYDHGNLGGCFGALDATVRDLLGTVLPTRHAAVPLGPKDRSIYAGELDQERYLRAQHYYLAVAADVDPADLAIQAPRLFKVSSAGRIEQVTDHGLAGLPISHQSAPPSALPIKLDYTYFKLETSGEHWDSVRASREIAVYVPDEFPNPRVELLMLLDAEDVGG